MDSVSSSSKTVYLSFQTIAMGIKNRGTREKEMKMKHKGKNLHRMSDYFCAKNKKQQIFMQRILISDYSCLTFKNEPPPTHTHTATLHYLQSHKRVRSDEKSFFLPEVIKIKTLFRLNKDRIKPFYVSHILHSDAFCNVC